MGHRFGGGLLAALLAILAWPGLAQPPRGMPFRRPNRPYVVVGTGQVRCFDDAGQVILPRPGERFFGQDAQHPGPPPAYRNNGDGTVSDLETGLVWQQDPGDKVTWAQALAGAKACRLGGHDDWRLPSIKELYSLILFSGATGFSPEDSRPYLDMRFFAFRYGDVNAGERMIDAQFWSATEYVGTTMNGDPTVFGVNFADGRIKGYPKQFPGGQPNRQFARFVRSNPRYGINDFADNGDGTVTDRATGLMWQQGDSSQALDWEHALAYAAALALAGHRDWRLPNAKELQSIVDYTRAPAVTGTAALAPVFRAGDPEVWYWSSTTHLDGPPDRRGDAAVYVCFGRAWGFMFGQWLDVHGAGAQRSDPKSGDPAWFPWGRGPQGDQIRIRNYVKCVRG